MELSGFKLNFHEFVGTQTGTSGPNIYESRVSVCITIEALRSCSFACLRAYVRACVSRIGVYV